MLTNVMALVRMGNSVTDRAREVLDLWSGRGHKLNWDRIKDHINLSQSGEVYSDLYFKPSVKH